MSQSSLGIILDEMFEIVQRRETFLNVSKTDYYAFHHIILLLKCLVAGYGAKKFVPWRLTITILWLNFLNSMLAMIGWFNLVYNVSFFMATASIQAIVSFEDISFHANAVAWYVACWDPHFYFCLDVYVVVALLVYVYRAYKNYPVDAAYVFTGLFCAEWISNQLIEPMDLCNSLVTLFFPVMLATSFIPFDMRGFRLYCVIVADLIWLYYKLIRAKVIYPMAILCPFMNKYSEPVGELPDWIMNLYPE